MPEERVRKQAQRDKAQGKAASTQAGEFVREEIHHIREGKHGARSAKQAIAIGLSKARRAGVELLPPKGRRTTEPTRERAERDYARGHGAPAKTAPSVRRRRAVSAALKREGNEAASSLALSRQAHAQARSRTRGERSAAARAAARTKGSVGRKSAAKRAAKTRRSNRRRSPR